MSIKDLMKIRKKHFTSKCIVTLGIHVLNLIERIHSIGYIHCDIKPDNIMIGDHEWDPKERNKIYLIDFGISIRYLNENGEHLPMKKKVPFKGNIIFSSKHAFEEISLSRRDDIISLLYFLIFCINSDVTWIDKSKSVAD